MDDQTQTPQPDLNHYREQYSYYARKLLSDLGLGDLPQPERGQLLTAIETYVQQLLLNTLLENLETEHIEKAEQVLTETRSNDEVMVYLMTNVPNIELKIADALAKSYAQMVVEARQLARAITAKPDSPAGSPADASDAARTPAEPAPTASEVPIAGTAVAAIPAPSVDPLDEFIPPPPPTGGAANP